MVLSTLTNRYPFTLLLLALLLCMFIYVDVYLVNTSITIERVSNTTSGRLRTSSPTSYSLTTNNTWTTIPYSLYETIDIGDTIYVERSIITKALKGISFHEPDGVYTYHLDFIRAGLGRYLLPLLLAGIAFMFYFSPKIDNPKGRVNLCYGTVVMAIYLIFNYIDFQYLMS